MRHPFPGPGLGVRIIGEVTPERVELVRKADHIFISMIREAGLYNEVRVNAPPFPRWAANRRQITQAYAALDSNRGVSSILPLDLSTAAVSSIPVNGTLADRGWAIAVGVQGDSRVYGYICVLRAVTSLDMMSAEPYEFPWSLIKAVSRRIINEVDGIARVVYDTTSKPPGKDGPPIFPHKCPCTHA